MSTTVWKYEVVKRQIAKPFVCTVCGRRGRRQRTFRQTINPFNKNAAGQVKTRSEILLELDGQTAAWQPTVHERCE